MTLKDYFTHYYAVISRGDLDELAEFYVPESPLFQANKQQFEMMRQQFSFELNLNDVRLLAKQETLLIVQDALTFSAEIEGQQQQKTSSNIHTLVKVGDTWRLHNSNPLPETMVA